MTFNAIMLVSIVGLTAGAIGLAAVVGWLDDADSDTKRGRDDYP